MQAWVLLRRGLVGKLSPEVHSNDDWECGKEQLRGCCQRKDCNQQAQLARGSVLSRGCHIDGRQGCTERGRLVQQSSFGASRSRPKRRRIHTQGLQQYLERARSFPTSEHSERVISGSCDVSPSQLMGRKILLGATFLQHVRAHYGPCRGPAHGTASQVSTKGLGDICRSAVYSARGEVEQVQGWRRISPAWLSTAQEQHKNRGSFASPLPTPRG